VEASITEIMGAVGGLIGVLSGILAAYWKYNQDSHNKETDFKIEMQRKEAEYKLEQFKTRTRVQSYQRNRNSSIVYRQIYKILNFAKADRVYIVQPHPLKHADFLSIQFECTSEGVEGMRTIIQSLPMERVADFCGELTKNLWMYFDNIDTQVSDHYAKSLLTTNGSVAVAIKRLDSAKDWVGNIFAEFIDPPKISEQDLHKLMHEAAVNIQHNLPEFIGSPEEELPNL